MIMGEQTQPSARRIGDRERDAAASLLQQAVSDGRLTVEELDSRLAVVMDAKTYADLEPVVVDLAEGPSSLELFGSRPMTNRPAPAGYSADDPLVLDGSAKRVGTWTVPPYIRVDQGTRWARLDFQLATTESSVIDIDMIAGAGWVLFVLPPGWAADLDRLLVGSGGISVKVPREPARGKPLLLIHGSVGAGRLRLRTPNRRDLRRAERSRSSHQRPD